MNDKRHDYSKYFEVKKRLNGNEFCCCTEDTPESLRELIRDVHGLFTCLPNDWIYETISDAFDALQNDELDNCSINADVGEYDLIKWLQFPYAREKVQECIDEELICTDNFINMISGAQYEAMRDIYHAVNDWIELQRDELDYREIVEA